MRTQNVIPGIRQVYQLKKQHKEKLQCALKSGWMSALFESTNNLKEKNYHSEAIGMLKMW